MKKILTSILLLSMLLSCEKEAENGQSNQYQYLQKHIFNGNTQWVITRMEADKEREINGQKTLIWSNAFPDCRKDNIYQFGTLGVRIASIHLDENTSSCDPEEPNFVSQGLALDFSTDYKKAATLVRGAAMAKLFDLPYDYRVKLNGFEHSWEFEEVSPEKVVVKVLIPADQSAGMLESAAEVVVAFERVH